MKKLNLTTAIASIALAAATFAAPLTAQANDFRKTRVVKVSHPVKTVLVKKKVVPVFSNNRSFTTSYNSFGYNTGYVSSLDLQIAGLVRQLTTLKHTGRRSIGFNRRVSALELRIADMRRQRSRFVNVRNTGRNIGNVRNTGRRF